MISLPLKIGEKIKARKKTSNKWFETQDSIAYWDDFFKPKIVWASVGETQYSYVTEDFLLLDTNYFFSLGNPFFLLGILNSKLITWWINSEDTAIGSGGAYRHYKYNIEKLPIPNLKIKDISELTELVKNKLTSSNTETEIDHKIYKLYGLNDEEIKFISLQ